MARILVLDDLVEAVTTIVKILKNKGYQTVPGLNAVQAAGKINGKAPPGPSGSTPEARKHSASKRRKNTRANRELHRSRSARSRPGNLAGGYWSCWGAPW